MPLVFGGQGVTPSTRGQSSNEYTFQAGQAWIVPAGTWYVGSRKYARIQEFDQLTGIWRNIGSDLAFSYVRSDGVNVRVANQTGCAVGALITNVGSAYTSNPTITASAGGSIWQPIIGGAINSTVTVTAGGSGYTYPPLVQFSAPANPGIPATGYATMSAGAVSSITVVDQGAGYSAAPTVNFVNDPREGLNGLATGTGATAITTTTGAGTLTGLLCLDHGTVLTSLPTLTIAGGGGASAAATVLMDWSITGGSVSGAGTVYTAGAGFVPVTAVNRLTAGTAAITNPTLMANIVLQRPAQILFPTSAGGALTATGLQVADGGHYTFAPGTNDIIIGVGQAIVTGAATVALTVGGNLEVIEIFPI
jgi:hypothetical protein